MKILVVGGLVPWHPQAGGGQLAAYKLSEAVSAAGHSVDYLAVAPAEHQRMVEWGNFIYAFEEPGLLSSFRPALQSATSGRLDVYDVVHVHAGNETVGYYLTYALRRLVIGNPRFVITSHSPKVHAVPRSVGEACLAVSCRAADTVFAVSEFSRGDISRCFGVSPNKLRVTYNGVDGVFFRREGVQRRTKQGLATLLCCGRLNGPREQKGIDILLKSLALVVRHHQVVLNIIGTGARLDQYRALAEELHIQAHVKFLGFIEHDDMPAYYAQADLFVLPSRSEGFPLVLPEAMAGALPVVATAVGGVPEIVTDTQTGLLVPPEDPRQLAEAVNSLLGDPERMRAMGARGRKRVRKDYTWERVAERVMEGYDSVL